MATLLECINLLYDNCTIKQCLSCYQTHCRKLKLGEDGKMEKKMKKWNRKIKKRAITLILCRQLFITAPTNYLLAAFATPGAPILDGLEEKIGSLDFTGSGLWYSSSNAPSIVTEFGTIWLVGISLVVITSWMTARYYGEPTCGENCREYLMALTSLLIVVAFCLLIIMILADILSDLTFNINFWSLFGFTLPFYVYGTVATDLAWQVVAVNALRITQTTVANPYVLHSILSSKQDNLDRTKFLIDKTSSRTKITPKEKEIRERARKAWEDSDSDSDEDSDSDSDSDYDSDYYFLQKIKHHN